jgi:chemotaxis family two-component system response regulator Rcp1
MMTQDVRVAEILLVEDNEGDIELTREAFGDAIFRNNLHIAEDGHSIRLPI